MNGIWQPRLLSLAFVLGWQEIRQAYRRSVLGQYWLTIGMAVQIATIAAVFSLIFKLDLKSYLPFIAVSLILWTYISSSLNDGAKAFIDAEAMIKQVPLPLYTHVLKVQIRNFIAMLHNSVLIPIVLFLVGASPSVPLLLFPVGLMLIILNLIWISAILATISARFRDTPPMVIAATSVLFYVTPVMWLPGLLGNNQLAHFLLGLNPFYHLLQIARQPLLGEYPTFENWSIATVFAVVGTITAIIVAKRFTKKIPYWV